MRLGNVGGGDGLGMELVFLFFIWGRFVGTPRLHTNCGVNSNFEHTKADN